MIFKVTFVERRTSSRGGDAKTTNKIKLFDADNAEELEMKIKEYESDTECGYARKRLVGIERL